MILGERYLSGLELEENAFPILKTGWVMPNGERWYLAEVPHLSDVCIASKKCKGIIFVPFSHDQKGFISGRACVECNQKTQIDLFMLKFRLRIPL